MRHHSVRGVGIRYVLALTLPVTGIALVLYTVVQLFLAQLNGVPPASRRYARAELAGAPGALPAASEIGGSAAEPDPPAKGGERVYRAGNGESPSSRR